MMAKIITLTRHWKKLCLVSIPLAYGVNYVKNEHQISKHMRHICEVVEQYPIPKNSKVLVILNPVANKKQCEKKFQQYCEPILHMAGYSVDVVKTKHVGHAKSIMETLQKLPDIVVIAGGDGTSSEVVTGLTRRKEEICPILFLPLGEKNETALNLMQLDAKSKLVNNLSQCMLALVQGRIQRRPVIKFELIDNDSIEARKPIFGILSFSWGILKDIEINKEKYWYCGALKQCVSALTSSLTNKLNENILANMSCTPPCPGCNKCENFVAKKSFNISKFLNPNISKQPIHQVREHKLCSTEKYLKINAKQIDITCMRNSDSFFTLNTHIIESIPSWFDFCIKIVNGEKIHASTTFESRTIEVIPIEPEDTIFYIDGESYDARHIKISFLPNALKYFA